MKKSADKPTSNTIAITLLLINAILFASNIVFFLEGIAALHGDASLWYKGFVYSVSTAGVHTVIIIQP